ncbi:hypothetical protein HDU85_002580 [Gaertneriomyces sp. JEL0708]|nr:hypothetical protein HDU85_002580 [Gaertneriomyces sp. JEL0708]
MDDPAPPADSTSSPHGEYAPVPHDGGIEITPIQAVELHKRAQEIKNGYALLAMKKIEGAFQGLDDENAGDIDENGGMGNVGISEEEEFLNKAVAEYASKLDEYGLKSGTAEFTAAMSSLTQPVEEPTEATVEETQPLLDESATIAKPKTPQETSLPYHEVWETPKDVLPIQAPLEETQPLLEEEPVEEIVPPPQEEVVKQKEEVPTVPTPVARKPSRLPPVPHPARKTPLHQHAKAKQSFTPRALDLSFASFGFPNTSDPHALRTIVQRGPSPTSIHNLPTDANALRMVGPSSSKQIKGGTHLKDSMVANSITSQHGVQSMGAASSKRYPPHPTPYYTKTVKPNIKGRPIPLQTMGPATSVLSPNAEFLPPIGKGAPNLRIEQRSLDIARRKLA